jgi:hypothetical protein
VNWGTEDGAEGGGRKYSKKSCARIGPTKKELILSARLAKVESRFVYPGLNFSVVELLLCTGVPTPCGRSNEGFGGGVVGMEGNRAGCAGWVDQKGKSRSNLRPSKAC